MSYIDFINSFDKKHKLINKRERLENVEPGKLTEIYNLEDMLFFAVKDSDNNEYVMPCLFSDDCSYFIDVWTGEAFDNNTHFPVVEGCDYREVIVKNVLERKGYTLYNEGLDLSGRYESAMYQSILGRSHAFCEKPLISAFTALNIAEDYYNEMQNSVNDMECK